MRLIRFLLPRLVIVFVVVASLSYVFVLRPQTARAETIEEHRRQATQLHTAVGATRGRLEALPSPASITPQAKNQARDYAQKFREARGTIKVEAPPRLDPLPNPDLDLQVDTFNRIIEKTDYWAAIDRADQALNRAFQLVSHHGVAMRSLGNFLEYDPAQDLSSTNRSQLEANLQATSGGLEITLQRLLGIPKYVDPSFREIQDLIRAAQISRQGVVDALGSDGYEKKKADFITLVHATQSEIVTNRSTFWQQEARLVLDSLKEAETALAPFIVELRNVP